MKIVLDIDPRELEAVMRIIRNHSSKLLLFSVNPGVNYTPREAKRMGMQRDQLEAFLDQLSDAKEASER